MRQLAFLSFPADPALQHAARIAVMAFIGPGMSEADGFEMETALGESLSNASLYGSPAGILSLITIRIMERRRSFHVYVQDTGPGFDWSLIPIPDLLAEHGRGVWLIKAMAAGVWEDGGRRCHVCKARVPATTPARPPPPNLYGAAPLPTGESAPTKETHCMNRPMRWPR